MTDSKNMKLKNTRGIYDLQGEATARFKRGVGVFYSGGGDTFFRFGDGTGRRAGEPLKAGEKS